jgi:hypothetical protein
LARFRVSQADAVTSVDLEPHGADVPPIPANVALHRVALRGLVADDHQAFDLLVPPDA